MQFEWNDDKAASNLSKHDDLRAEYDLKSLRVRKLGSGRKNFGRNTVRLEPDVAEMFPTADAVNEALRFLIRVMQDNQAIAPTAQASPSKKP
ncbi:MAG: hypothetical protein ACPGVO_09835 [Spirulinaceae cyanobacterium]